MSQCFNCSKIIDKSWLHLQNMPQASSSETGLVDRHICGYSCYKRLTEQSALPIKLWSHIVNKSDYEGLIRPVYQVKKKDFEYLTLQEIKSLSDSDKEQYFMEKEDQIEICPLMKKIREDINIEDERTSYLEEVSSESDWNDDY
jgi:hypothetical protein